jgi:signal transduction histidine kinase
VNRIRRCIHEALALIDVLNALARAERGTVDVLMESTDIGALLQSLAEEYQARAKAAGLSLSVFTDPDVPNIESSAARVRQIASNLLSNAIKYTPAGSVTIRASVRPGASAGFPGDWVAVDFIDTGRGIPLEKQEFIFEEFSRLADDKPGAGLGLAISRVLAEALGGHITAESRTGLGSTFTLWLPLEHQPPPVQS